MNDNCPLGFECVINESINPYLGNSCANIHTCYTWTITWELPYYWSYNSFWNHSQLIISFIEAYYDLQNELSENVITSQYDFRKYFAEYGFAEAVALPYFFRQDGSMMVSIAEDNICLEEIQKAGYANSITLPVQRMKEYYYSCTYEGFSYQQVNLFLCGEEAINAFNAGYANAIELLTPLTNRIYCCW